MDKDNNIHNLSGNTKKLFTKYTLVFCFIGLAINLFLANLVIKLNLPLYIDNVGSILVGALAGPIPGMTVGFLSNAINSFGDPISRYYGILTVIMALFGSLFANKHYFNSVKGFFIMLLLCILVSDGIGSSMTYILYGGGGIGGLASFIATPIYNLGIPALIAQFIGDTIIDLADKSITLILVILCLKYIPNHIKSLFPLGYLHMPSNENNIKIPYRKQSIQTVILKILIGCASLISIVSIIISFYMYCNIVSDYTLRLTYLIELISISFAIILLICAFTTWFANKYIVEPINNIVYQSKRFEESLPQNWLSSDTWINKKDINSGDEIEELYNAICKEQETVATNVIKMKETEEKLRHSKELEDALHYAKEANEAKGQFLSRMSHEIRTPLNAVIGYMTIAKDETNHDKIMHCIENSELAAKHLLNIINDVLDISSIESGRMKIAHEEFDLKKQITSLSTLFYNQSKEKNIDFKVDIKDLTQEWVIGDTLRLNQILMNVLSNAVKFTPDNGKITFSIIQTKHNSNKLFYKFIISDNGIGMSKEYQTKLFTPFVQESAITAQKYGGTGLGLSITNNLISMMSGAIEVQSIQGQGSTFTITIPLEASKNIHQEININHYSHLRALIIDDEKESCVYIKHLLKQCGIKSDIVTNGNDGIKQIKRRQGSEYSYDFCIIDWNMPEINGIETTKKIRNECNLDIPIIIATAYDVYAIEDDAKKAGATNIIAKPLFQSTMFDLLVNTFGKYNPTPSDNKTINLEGMHVLLAEDNEMNLEIAKSILEKAHIKIDSAYNGKEAVEKYINDTNHIYDAILMDIQMPIMDGYDATKTIRALDTKEAKEIPIIAMTANAFNEDVAAALACGMNGHIAKPINYDKLFNTLKSIMEKG